MTKTGETPPPTPPFTKFRIHCKRVTTSVPLSSAGVYNVCAEQMRMWLECVLVAGLLHSTAALRHDEKHPSSSSSFSSSPCPSPSLSYSYSSSSSSYSPLSLPFPFLFLFLFLLFFFFFFFVIESVERPSTPASQRRGVV